MQTSNQSSQPFKESLPLQNSMVQLSTNPLSFTPRKKISLNDDAQFNQLRNSLVSESSNGQTSGRDLTKSQATFSFSPRAPVSRESGTNGFNTASPLGK